MPFFGNRRRDFSIQPPRQQVDGTPFFVTDSANIDFTLNNLNLTADLTFTGVTAGTYGDATNIPVLQIDQWGRVTGVTLQAISPSGLALETNGTPNGNQTLLNLVAGTNMTITDDGLGNITFDATGGGGGSGTVTSVSATVPLIANPFLSVNVPNPTTTPSIDLTANGLVSQYVRGDGSLANFPNSTGGGASVNYYLNGSISQGTFGGVTYYQMSKTPILGGGTNFIRTNGAGNGYIASFITDAGDPSFLNIPGGNWNLELYFNSSASGGSPQFYGEIYKVDVTNVFTLVASGSTNPEGITNGTTVDQYFTSIPVPQTSLLITDRLAVRIYVITGGRTITLHTENGNLCEVLTTFTTGLTALNGLTDQVQNFTTGTTGTDFNITSVSSTHTFNLPTASSINRGALSTSDWTNFNTAYLNRITTLTTTGFSGAASLISNTLNIPNYTLSGLGGVPTTRNLTINGVPHDLSADRSWTVGDVFTTGSYADPSWITSLAWSKITGAPGFLTAAITSLNGLTAATQTFATPGTTGTTPNWNSVTSTHTLNIPLASAAGVTAGLISKTEYDTFNGKQDALTLTTTGTSGPATLIGSTLNIPQYSGGGGGGNSIGELTADVTAGPASSPSQSVPATLNTSYKSGSCGVVFDGQGGVISNGRTAYVQVPYKGTITGWTLVAAQSGSCTVTVFKDTFAAFPPVSPGDNIFGTQPALVGVQTNSATGTTVAVAAGDWIGFTISGVTTVTWVNLTLSITKII